MTRILQVNLNCCKVAQQLLLQTATEKKADIMIICEQNKTLPHWYADTDGKAAIAMHQAITPEEIGHPGRGYMWVRIRGIRIYSCYVSPNISIDDYRDYLERLEASIRATSGEVILAGDFNAKHAEWGSVVNDLRGNELATLAASLNLNICNVGNTPTFERGLSHSILDLTFATPHTAQKIVGWSVLDEETRSDHKYIYYSIGTYTERRGNCPTGWSRRKLDPQKLKQFLDGKDVPNDACQLMEYITGACDAAMPRLKPARSYHKPQYWWTNEIAELRRASLKARRQYQKAVKRGPAEEQKRICKEARKSLRIAIRKSQDNCWKDLCAQVDRDPWGTPYRTVMRKLGKRQPIPTIMIPAIIAELFPIHPAIEEEEKRAPAPIPTVTQQELQLASTRLSPGKAPGPDGVPNEALKVAVRTNPAMFQNVFSKCLANGIFPTPWKRARLVLLRKGDKPANLPSSYRPLCMLDTTGKLYERIISNRIEEAMAKEKTSLADNQYGFRKGRSTIDAIEKVMNVVKDAGKGTIYQRQLCVLITLDVANAFNSASCRAIIQAMTSKNIPEYLVCVVRNYFCERKILHGEDQDAVALSSGVPQGSVLGPLLWSIMYDSLLTTEMPGGVDLIGFADDVAVVARSWRVEHLEEIVNKSLGIIYDWMREHWLRLATHKTEAVMLTRKKGYRTPTFTVGGQRINTQNCIRYLGVEIDSGRRFKVHEQTVGAKATKTAQALSRILPNIGGPSTAKRQLLSSVVHSQLLYAAPIWQPLLDHRADSDIPIKGDYAVHMKAAQRQMALRVTRAYRTVSFEAVTLIASMPPITLLAKERCIAHRAPNRHEALKTARKETIKEWQREWDSSGKGRWTHALIKDVKKWIERKHGDIDHYLTQMLTNKGCFKSYLNQIKKADSPRCELCDAPVDDANHTMFECDAFENWRRQMYGEIGQNLTQENLVDVMLQEKSKWTIIATFISRVMRYKCEEERRRQAGLHLD